ncbi:MAG: leukotoxin LktA family filamentous adhesin [Cyanobacteriota bacterium]
MITKRKPLSILFIIFTLLILNNEITLSQTNITGVPGYTTVTNQPGSSIYNINSQKIINNGDAVLNRYTNFYLDKNNTANIYLGTPGGLASTAINVVNNLFGNPTTINGILKLVSGLNSNDPTGGNLIFVDPNGIMVGKDGIVNAGSIHLSTSCQTYAQLSGTPSEINLNDPTQDHLLTNQNIIINGTYRFNSISGAVRIDGRLDTLLANTPTGMDPGVNIFATDINISNTGKIYTDHSSYVNLVTGRDVSWTGLTNIVNPQTNLGAGGQLRIDGTITSPQGNILGMVNTTDIANNIINFNGAINATSLQPNGTGGAVLLDVPNYTSGPAASGIAIDNGLLASNGNATLQTPNNININNSNSLLSSKDCLSLQGNGMYLAGNYYSDYGNITVDNIGTKPLLIDANLYSSSGNIYIFSHGYAFLGYSQSLAVPPANNNIFQANGSVLINTNPLTSYANIQAQNGDVDITSGCLAEFYGPGNTFAREYLAVTGNNIIVDQPFSAISDNLYLQSNTGNVILGQHGSLSSHSGTVYINRGNTTGPLNAELYGPIIAENTTTGLIFGNGGHGNDNRDDIIIDGTTMGPYNGIYNTTTTLYPNQHLAPNLFVDSFQVMISNIPPSPPQPPKPPTPPPPPKNPNRPNDNKQLNQNNQVNQDNLNDQVQSYTQTALNNAGGGPDGGKAGGGNNSKPFLPFTRLEQTELYEYNVVDIITDKILQKWTIFPEQDFEYKIENLTYDSNGNVIQNIVINYDVYDNPKGKEYFYPPVENGGDDLYKQYTKLIQERGLDWVSFFYKEGAFGTTGGQGKSPGGDQMAGGAAGNVSNSQYDYQWYKNFAEANKLDWASLFYGGRILDIPKPISVEEASTAEKQAFHDMNKTASELRIVDSELELADKILTKAKASYDKEVIAVKKAEDSYKKIREANKKAKDEYVQKVRKEWKEKEKEYKDAEEAYKAGKLSKKAWEIAQKDHKEAEMDYISTVMIVDFGESGNVEGESLTRAKQKLSNTESELDKATKDYNETLEKHNKATTDNKQAMEKYYDAQAKHQQAVKARDSMSSGQKVTVGSDGKVTVDGKAADVQGDKTGQGLKPQNKDPVQSLNPRSKLDALGKKPKFPSTTEQGEGTVILEQGEDKTTTTQSSGTYTDSK